MSELHKSPAGIRLHIAILGRRNVGKSSLMNALTGQDTSIVSEQPGTTTDPVTKGMELLPLGPIILMDTPGLDDEGTLGSMRIKRGMRILEKTDFALLVLSVQDIPSAFEENLLDSIRSRNIPVLVVINKCDLNGSPEAIQNWVQQRNLPSVLFSAQSKINLAELKQLMIAHAASQKNEGSLLSDLVNPGDSVILVVPIDQAAPKGRLILPQAMAIRDLLDHDAFAMVVKERELRFVLGNLKIPPKMVVTDSQAFLKVAADTPKEIWLTSFSILMARHKGNLTQFVKGAQAISRLKVGDSVLVAEGCTHHRQGDDIGTVQIPRWLRQKVGGDLKFEFCSGVTFPEEEQLANVKLIIHCGGCTLNRREMLYRQSLAQRANIPMTNYGLFLAYIHGILPRALQPFHLEHSLWMEQLRSTGQMKNTVFKVERILVD